MAGARISNGADQVAEEAERTEGKALASGGAVRVGDVVPCAQMTKKLKTRLTNIILSGRALFYRNSSGVDVSIVRDFSKLCQCMEVMIRAWWGRLMVVIAYRLAELVMRG